MHYKKTPEVHSPTPLKVLPCTTVQAGVEAGANRKMLSEVARALFTASC